MGTHKAILTKSSHHITGSPCVNDYSHKEIFWTEFSSSLVEILFPLNMTNFHIIAHTVSLQFLSESIHIFVGRDEGNFNIKLKLLKSTNKLMVLHQSWSKEIIHFKDKRDQWIKWIPKQNKNKDFFSSNLRKKLIVSEATISLLTEKINKNGKTL